MRVRSWNQRLATSACLALLVAACGGDGPTEPAHKEPGVCAVLGAGVIDTIDAQPLHALVVEVRGPGGRFCETSLPSEYFHAEPHSP